MTVKFRPLHDRILVKRLTGEEKTKGGIIIPESAKEKPLEGEIVACGNGKIMDSGQTMKLDVKNGDRILFTKYTGSDVKIDGEEYTIMREEDILGIVS
jgi:chaperonin GroES